MAFLMSLKKPVSLLNRLWVLYAFTVVGIVAGEFEMHRAGVWGGFIPQRMIFLVIMASPAMVISSLIQMSRRLLIIFGLYHLLAVLILSIGIAHSESSTASLGYLYLIFGCIPISTICYLVWLKFTKQEKEKLNKSIRKFYTQTSLPLLFIISILLSLILIAQEIFLGCLMYFRWGISPNRSDKVRLLLLVAALWIVSRVAGIVLFLIIL
ncbi:hypothetical protein [Candidatus Poriferisocius sp.]|uniref:hypothetical protein n=1 Tax=Candidatus Poriferisocius sp. TaxID=3101276 RepID=UPI003B02B0AF